MITPLQSILENKFLFQYYSFGPLNGDMEYQYLKFPYVKNFISSDTPELLQQNLITQPNDWYYRNNDVNYTLNSYGYRTKEFDDIEWENSIVIFGCSFVFGVGVDDKHTISYFLEEMLNIPVINMGYFSSSVQTCLHNSIILKNSKYPNPKAIVYLYPNLNRRQVYNRNKIEHLGDWSSSEKRSINDLEDSIISNIINIKNIRTLWNDYNILEYSPEKKVSFAIEPKKIFYLNKILDFRSRKLYSRDLSHPGKEYNYEVAKKIKFDLLEQVL